MASRKEQLQKRKAREKRRQEFQLSRHRTGESSLAYSGNKYKTREYVEVVMEAETGIYQAHVMMDRMLTDYQVQAALEEFVRRLRRDDLPPPADPGCMELGVLSPTDLIITNIRLNWERHFEFARRPSRESLVGVLRTILGSVGVWKTVSPQSRGYLSYIEGFLRKLGVSLERIDPDGRLIEDPPPPEIFSVARAWADGVGDDARIRFEALATELIAAGQGELVAEACQQAMGSIASGGATPIVEQLGRWSIRAQQSARPALSYTLH